MRNSLKTLLFRHESNEFSRPKCIKNLSNTAASIPYSTCRILLNNENSVFNGSRQPRKFTVNGAIKLNQSGYFYADPSTTLLKEFIPSIRKGEFIMFYGIFVFVIIMSI